MYDADFPIGHPVKYVTPYGGRLEWTLPGKNKLVAHLKDKKKIRHRKRWSQVNNHRFHGFNIKYYI